MSYVYLFICLVAGLFICDDIGLGHIHPIKGLFLMLAIGWNVTYIIYKLERKYRC